MLFFLVCLLLYCDIFNLTGKSITLIIITSRGSVILMTTVAEILQGQIFNSMNQTKQPSYVQLLLRYNRWDSISQTCLWVLLSFQTWSKLYVGFNCTIHFAKVFSQKSCEQKMSSCENDTQAHLWWSSWPQKSTARLIWNNLSDYMHLLSLSDAYTCNKSMGTHMHAILGLCTQEMK